MFLGLEKLKVGVKVEWLLLVVMLVWLRLMWEMELVFSLVFCLLCLVLD